MIPFLRRQVHPHLLSSLKRFALSSSSSSGPSAATSTSTWVGVTEDFERINAKKQELSQLIAKRLRYPANTLIDVMLKEFRPSIFLFNVVLKAYVQMGDTSGLKRILERLAGAKMSPNIFTYNILMDYYRGRGEMEEATRVLKRIEQEGLSPTAATYTTLISGYVDRGEVEKAEEIFSLMQEKQVTPDLYTFNSMLMGALAAGNDGRAAKLMDEMKTNPRTHPNYVTYRVIWQNLIRRGEIAAANQLFANHLKDDPRMTAQDFLSLIPRLAAGKYFEEVKTVVGHVVESFGEIDPRDFGGIWKNLLPLDHASLFKVFECMASIGNEPLPPQIVQRFFNRLANSEDEAHLLAIADYCQKHLIVVHPAKEKAEKIRRDNEW